MYEKKKINSVVSGGFLSLEFVSVSQVPVVYTYNPSYLED
jgi:hypothetical protein